MTVAVRWEQAEQWRPDALLTLVGECQGRKAAVEGVSDALFASGAGFESQGDSPEEIRGFITRRVSETDRLVDQVAELMMATAEAADGVSLLQTKVHECHSFAAMHELIILPGGGVMISPARLAACADDPVLYALALRDKASLEEMIREAVTFANQVDTDYRSRLEKVAEGKADSGEDHASASQGLPDLPDSAWSPTEVAAWWSSLSDEERQRIIREHPDAIGNLDGIDIGSRHEANMIRLPRLIEEAQAEVDRLERYLDNSISVLPGGPGESWSRQRAMEELQSARNRLADLQEIDGLLSDDNRFARIAGGGDPGPEMRLALLDAESGRQVHAAVAIGDPDSAEHVATFTPGIKTNVRDTLRDYVGFADDLQSTASARGNGESVATIAWLGYDAPTGPTDPATFSTARAEEGAASLQGFVEGMHASRSLSEAGDANLSMFGHSYGSTTTGIAAANVRHGVVDDVTLFGSPGSGVHDVREYNISGTPYVSAVPSGDIVQGVGTDRNFGANPTRMQGFEHLSDQGPVGPGTAAAARQEQFDAQQRRVVERPGNHFVPSSPDSMAGMVDRHGEYMEMNPDGSPTAIMNDFADVLLGRRGER